MGAIRLVAEVDPDPVVRWTYARLTETVPGSNRAWWRCVGVPLLVEKGVLRPIGRSWLGRAEALKLALLGGEPEVAP